MQTFARYWKLFVSMEMLFTGYFIALICIFIALSGKTTSKQNGFAVTTESCE